MTIKSTLLSSPLGSAGIGVTMLAAAVAAPPWIESFLWRERSPLPLPRGGYASGTWHNKLVIAGGSYWQGGEKLWTTRTDLFDPEKDTWEAGPPLPAPHGNGASATVNGTLFLLGGTVEGKVSDRIVQLDSHGWKNLASGLPQALDLPVAAAIGESIYVFGGLTTAGDPSSATRTFLRGDATGAWKQLADFPGEPRVTAAFAALDDRLYIFGGCAMSRGEVRNLSDAWVYAPASDRWDRLPDAPVKRRAWGSAVQGKHILLLGGYTEGFSADIYLYDVAASEYRRAGSLPHPIADAKFITIGARLYSAGGEPEMKVRAAGTIEGEAQAGAGHN